MDFTIEVPLSTSVSFGQVSINILMELHKRGLNPNIFSISQNIDLNAFNKLTDEFKNWLNLNMAKALQNHNRINPTFKLWHFNGSLHRLSDNQTLFTFYECNEPTLEELNIIKNNNRVLVSSTYSKEILNNAGAKNVDTCFVGFDENSFHKTNKKYAPEDVITFSLGGKMEQRKNSLRILKLFAKKYGNNRKYLLNCAIFNHFIDVRQQEALIHQALEGKRYFNVNILPWMGSNAAYNDFLNAGDIDLTGLSGAEGWNLPSFNATCLGKWSIVLNAHAHKDWANKDNSISIEPNNKMVRAEDGVFFKAGQPFNQGSWYDFDDDIVIAAMELAVEKYAKKPNLEGEKLKEKFTYNKTVEKLLNYE